MASNLYKNALTNETRDLLELASKKQISKPAFREAVIKQIIETFSRQRSVLLVGAPGVGKTAIIYGLAHEMRLSRHRGFHELSTSTIMAGTHYLGDWESKADSIIKAAAKQRGVLYFTDIWNLPTAGISSKNPSNLLDALRPRVLSGDILLLGEVTSVEFAAMQQNPQLIALFEPIHIEPLTTEQTGNVVHAEIDRLQLAMQPEATSKVLDLCQQFLPHSDGPGPALRLLQQVAHYKQQKAGINEYDELDSNFVEKVFSIYSGLPLFIISRSVVKPAREMRQWFQDRVIGQEQAIESVLETIALYKAGLHDATRPIGTFLFVGPTGVGKTELAKTLATFLFGSETRLLRFDMSEFKDFHAFEMLVGVADRHDKPARLLNPVKAQPFQVILFDEIEKAHPNVWDLLLQILDEGRLTSPKGGTVNFRNTIFIATSNAGAKELDRLGIGFTGDANQVSDKDIHKLLEQVFRPELINRFQHIVRFFSLTKTQVKRIAQRELGRILEREGIVSRNLIIETSEEVLNATVEHGYDQNYGARALKRELQRRIVLPIANYLLENNVDSGAIIKLDSNKGSTRVRVLQTEKSRAYNLEHQPVLSADGKAYTLKDAREKSKQLTVRLATLSEQIGEDALRQQLKQYDQLRCAPDFWSDRDSAYQQIAQADRINQTIERIDHLRDELTEIKSYQTHKQSRHEQKLTNNRLHKFEHQFQTAWRELTNIGNDGRWDVLLYIQPVGVNPLARDLLFNTYRGWAREQHYQTSLLCEPLNKDDPAGIWIKGAYTYGLLQLEAGLHRVREGEDLSVARVSIAPVTMNESNITITRHEALKQKGVYGGKIRSRLMFDTNPIFILQNHSSLSENQEVAQEIGPSWIAGAHSSDNIVRRYTLKPFLIRDPIADISSGKQELLKPPLFHELLCKRIDINSATDN